MLSGGRAGAARVGDGTSARSAAVVALGRGTLRPGAPTPRRCSHSLWLRAVRLRAGPRLGPCGGDQHRPRRVLRRRRLRQRDRRAADVARSWRGRSPCWSRRPSRRPSAWRVCGRARPVDDGGAHPRSDPAGRAGGAVPAQPDQRFERPVRGVGRHRRHLLLGRGRRSSGRSPSWSSSSAAGSAVGSSRSGSTRPARSTWASTPQRSNPGLRAQRGRGRRGRHGRRPRGRAGGPGHGRGGHVHPGPGVPRRGRPGVDRRCLPRVPHWSPSGRSTSGRRSAAGTCS